MKPTALNEYVTLGTSGLRVSPLALGGMTFGEELGWGASEEVSKAIIDRYLEKGGNFIDTANWYTYGHSEKIIGDHVGRTPSRRDRVVIATKFYGNMFPGDPNGGGAGRQSVIGACDESLRRLQTDYIDVYWMHAWDRHTPIEETMRAVDDLVRAGKVRYIGFSDSPAWKIAQAQTLAQLRGLSPLIGVQLEYSLLERSVEGELIPASRELGLGVIAWSPLKNGVLTGKYTRQNAGTKKGDRGFIVEGSLNDRAYVVIDELVRVANELETTPANVALAWVRAREGVTTTLLGVRTPDQLDQNLVSLSVQLSDGQHRRLDDVSAPQLAFPARMLAHVGSFMHGGISVNGDAAPVSPLGRRAESPRF